MEFKNSNSGVFSVVILLSVLYLNSFVYSKELPLVLRDLKCPQTEEFRKCFLLNGNKAIPLLAKGDPEYGIPNLMPLVIPFMSLISTPTLQLNLTNIQVHGLDKMRIIGERVDLVKNVYMVNLKGDNITVVGDYSAEGRILVMPLNGKGRFKLYFKNGRYRSTSFVRVIEKDGDKYFKPEDSRLEARFELMTFDLDNLFDGNKQLGDQVNAFLNENWESLVKDFGPTVEDAVAKIIKDIFVDLASVVPIKNMFI
ncbi:protein takeout-like [Coccinella septempunctata]|uniref:protein takeout-like n=1 Tax=Coccinella septempunctata TaxID=41139 RepID=UPI001D08F093|nr:protein takeout-like [Coccinella septempunctata]